MVKLGGHCPLNVCGEHNSDPKEFARGELIRYYRKQWKYLKRDIPEDKIMEKYCIEVCPVLSC